MPRKNLREFAGHNLLHYALTKAKSFSYFDRVALVTDSNIARKRAKGLGFPDKDIIDEPQNLTEGRIEDVMVYTLDRISKTDKVYDYVYLLQCTAPLTEHRDMKLALATLIETEADFAVSVCECTSPLGVCKVIRGNYIRGFLPKSKRGRNRQEHPQKYQLNAAIYVGKWDIWANKQDYYETKIVPVFMPKERSIDVDDMMDFKIAELLMRRDGTYE